VNTASHDHAPAPGGDASARRPPVVSPACLAAVVDSSDFAIIGTGLDGRITDWNPGAERILGHLAAGILGTPLARLMPADQLAQANAVLEKVRDFGKAESFETRRLTADGRLLHVSITASPLKNAAGQVVGLCELVRDITPQKAQAREFARLARLYAASNQVNQTIVRATTRDELFQRICRILVEHGGFHMAWVGWHDPATRQILPVAVFGQEPDYLATVQVYSDDRPEGRGPTGQAFRTGRPCICLDMENNPITLPWRDKLRQRGFKSSTGLPIRVKGAVCGALTVYSDDPWFFQDKEIALLETVAGDVSFALDSLAEKAARREVEKIARDEQIFSAAMIESMPGILYFYDEQGRFLRWNRNFEAVSGYAAAEIARMHPLDFFPDTEKALLQERIKEVFARGESSVEASFVSKDGRITPYFFTGRQVVFDGQPGLVGIGMDISQRKQAEAALRQSESKLRALFEQAPLGIAVVDSTTGRFLTINPQYCKIVGYSAPEMLGLNFQQVTHPDDLAQDLANMQRLRAGVAAAFQMEKRYLCKDGSLVWVSLTCVPLWHAAGGPRQHIAMVGDITERKQAETRLAESEQKYRQLVELANSIILRWNTAGKITFLNEYGQRFFGYAADEIIGRHVVGTIVPPTDTAGRDLNEFIAEVCAKPDAFDRSINENMRRGGRIVWIAWSNRVLRDSRDQVVEILSVGTDVTKQHQAESALRVLNQTLELEVAGRTADLQAALVRAEAADRIKSAFLATMSHELRTPLNSIIGFTGIILQRLAGPLNVEQEKQLGMVQRSARHLLELINDVLDLSKIEAGQLEVHAAPFPLLDSLERVLALVRPMAEKKGLTLAIVAPPDLGEMTGDRRRFEQILLNLINNAIKFTLHGGVTVTAGILPDHRTLPEDAPRPVVRVRVTDTGIGIKPGDLAALFQPFHQVDTGISRQHEGTGLGLAICRRLATLLGGDIYADSEWGKGSEFTVILPLQKPIAP